MEAVTIFPSFSFHSVQFARSSSSAGCHDGVKAVPTYSVASCFAFAPHGKHGEPSDKFSFEKIAF